MQHSRRGGDTARALEDCKHGGAARGCRCSHIVAPSRGGRRRPTQWGRYARKAASPAPSNTPFGWVGGVAMAPTAAMSGWFFFQAEDGIRDVAVTGVQTCALPI